VRPRTYIHVGFSNTGTTSLQRNFFPHREEIFFAGQPYHERGGLFTLVRSAEDFKYDETYVKRLCRQQLFGDPAGKLVISDEMLCESAQLYYAPYLVPRDVIARRLFRLFHPAKIIFTIRNQETYVQSMYFNLKRNSAFRSRMPVPPLSSWYRETVSLFRGSYLQNLNFQETIGLYEELFGRSNILVLPLECVVVDGAPRYLQTLCDFMELKLSDEDVARFKNPENARMSVRQDSVAELLSDDRFSSFFADLENLLGRNELVQLLNEGERASTSWAPDDLADLRQRVASGNRRLADDYDLDLERYGYPMAAPGAAARPVSSAANTKASKKSPTARAEELDALLELERRAHASQIEEIERQFEEERNALLARIDQVDDTLGAERTTYVARINELQGRLDGQPEAFIAQIDTLQGQLRAERDAHAAHVAELQTREKAEQDALIARIRELGTILEAERDAFVARIARLEATLQAEREVFAGRIADLEETLHAERAVLLARNTEVGAERDAYVARILGLEETLHAERDAFVGRITDLDETLRAERAALLARIAELEAMKKLEMAVSPARAASK